MARRLREHGIDPAPHIARTPAIVNTQRGGYLGGTAEHRRLTMAREICEPAAIESASWGLFQIMGFHWRDLGYDSAEQFERLMQRSEGAQLDAFVRFIEANPHLHKALRAGKWAQFAAGYNGPDYKANLYDVKLARAFERYSARAISSINANTSCGAPQAAAPLPSTTARSPVPTASRCCKATNTT